VKITITGGTGFIGTALTNKLSLDYNEIVLLTRSTSKQAAMHNSIVRYVSWNPYSAGDWQKEIDGSTVVINLVGKNIFEQRWNEKVKKEIRDSRVIPTTLIVEAISKAKKKPELFLSASAVGFYGDTGDSIITEESSVGNDFLAHVVQAWEGAAYKAEQYGVRVATPRIGIVLEKNGGMIGKMLLPFQLFVGGPIGNGKQYIPWVHMEDVVNGILYPIKKNDFSGIYNLTAPSPITMKELCSKLGNVLHRPSWIPVPVLALTLLFGEGAKIIASGQNVRPQKLQNSGFVFSYSNLELALKNIFS
jgi:uncharacterized protein